MQGSTNPWDAYAFKLVTCDATHTRLMGITGGLNLKQYRRAYYMRDWKQINLATEWRMFYLEDDAEVWLVEHQCKDQGTTAYDDKVYACGQCNEKLPSKLLTAIKMFLNRDKIRV